MSLSTTAQAGAGDELRAKAAAVLHTEEARMQGLETLSGSSESPQLARLVREIAALRECLESIRRTLEMQQRHAIELPQNATRPSPLLNADGGEVDDSGSRLLSAGEVAGLLGLSRTKVYSLCDTGQLRFVRIPGVVPGKSRRKCVRIEESAVEEFLKRFTDGAETASSLPRIEPRVPAGYRTPPSGGPHPPGVRVVNGVVIPDQLARAIRDKAERLRLKDEKLKEKQAINENLLRLKEEQEKEKEKQKQKKTEEMLRQKADERQRKQRHEEVMAMHRAARKQEREEALAEILRQEAADEGSA